ncbi:hypothetical protein [Pseudoxanthomonas sp. PXM02]|uniref:hypothetical protein n=1 Tax=Pseudoxanthomonas sp. PXM02 TaxID=2769294 RepID=UPI0017826BD4|nr:hypothetical protein [Pseudoxanthomonas sp. PXM02]MBD9478499.1 hypothetical protein [Pseudoxanthomonas sp. PXM02]
MLTVDQVTIRLNEAEAAIRDGQIGSNPHEFIETLWAQVLEECPPEARIGAYQRLLGLSELLGIRHTSVPEERLAGPQWDMFLAALEELPDAREDELIFWRAIDHAKAPLFDGVTEEDGAIIETAVQAELNRRGLATPGDFEP